MSSSYATIKYIVRSKRAHIRFVSLFSLSLPRSSPGCRGTLCNQSLHKLRLKREVDKVVSLLRREVGSDFLENTRLVIAFCVRGASFRLTYKQHFVGGSRREGAGWESSHAHSESV